MLGRGHSGARDKFMETAYAIFQTSFKIGLNPQILPLFFQLSLCNILHLLLGKQSSEHLHQE